MIQRPIFFFPFQSLLHRRRIGPRQRRTNTRAKALRRQRRYYDSGRKSLNLCSTADGSMYAHYWQVENLFYNTPARLAALRSSSEEYARILDVVTKYAVHNPSVAFVCKKVSLSCHTRVGTIRTGIRQDLQHQILQHLQRLQRLPQSACFMAKLLAKNF